MNKQIKELSPQQVLSVSGGNALVVAGMAGAVLAFAYQVGKDMAERDNRQCLAPN